MNDEKPQMSDQFKREQEQKQWGEDWRRHSRMAQELTDPVDRWNYLCERTKDCAMIRKLLDHLEQIGCEVKKPVLDWTEFHKAVDNIGKEPCQNDGCNRHALPGSDYCILCKRKLMAEAERNMRKAREESYR